MRLKGRRIAFGVSGGIAAYKALDCIRLLTEAEAEVRVLMTPEATRFVTPLTFEALSYHPVAYDWLEAKGMGEKHIELSEWAEVLVIAPATANTLAKLANGFADEILSGTALATRAPLVLAPAMNDLMFTHLQTQANLQTLAQRGAAVVQPASGRLATGKVGVGKMASAQRIVAVTAAVLNGRRNLGQVPVVITAGGTREPIDPVRYVGNFSSGKMGRALADVAAARGADVTLITTAPTEPEGISEVAVNTAEEMLAEVRRAADRAEILVMAAAVADYRPAEAKPSKIKRRNQDLDLRLEPSVDILAAVGRRNGLFRVGFAAETEEIGERALDKLTAKDLDLIVANQVGLPDSGLGSDFNAVTIVSPKGVVAQVIRMPKWEVAEHIWDAIHTVRNGGS
jgi:phosphopantothenoylcysteine decarboxylase/phosphopantothenate--cysteine ligase